MSTRVEVGSIGSLGGCGVIRWIDKSKRMEIIPDGSACGCLCLESASCRSVSRLVLERVTVRDAKNTDEASVYTIIPLVDGQVRSRRPRLSGVFVAIRLGLKQSIPKGPVPRQRMTF